MGQGWTRTRLTAGTHRQRAAHLLLALLAAGAASPARPTTPPTPGFVAVLATIQGGETLFWQRLPEDPAPRELARIQHEPGFLPRAAVSPDGRRLAYTWLPEGSRDNGPSARLDLLDLTSGAGAQLAAEVDLRGAPLWSRDSSAVLFRRTYRRDDAASRVEFHARVIDRPGGTQAVLVEEANTLVPLLWSPEGGLLYGRWGTGVDLRRSEPGAAAPRTLARLSTGPAHNLSLSPDGRSVAYTRPLGPSEPGQHGLFLVSLATGTVSQRWSEASDSLNPVWQPDVQALTIATRSPPGALVNVPRADDLFGGPPQTVQAWQPGRLEVPVAWSPDGRWLFIRSLQGTRSSALTGEELVLVNAASGVREAIRHAGYTTFIGWRALAE